MKGAQQKNERNENKNPIYSRGNNIITRIKLKEDTITEQVDASHHIQYSK